MRHAGSGSKRLRQVAVGSCLALAVLAPTTAAAAADYPDGGSTTTVPGDRGEVGGTSAARVETRGGLPFTGGDVLGVAAIGAGAVVVGGVLTVQSRRRRADTRSSS